MILPISRRNGIPRRFMSEAAREPMRATRLEFKIKLVQRPPRKRK